MLRPIIFLCSALILLAAPLYAKDSDYEKSVARAVSAIETESYSEAVAELQNALTERPNDPQALLYLGIAKSRINDPSAEDDLKQSLRSDPANSRVNLELGNIYLKRGVYAEATDYYEATLQVEKEGEIAEAAHQGLRLIATRSSGKRWNANFLTGLQYDSNVILNAEGSPLPTGVSQKGDWRGIFNLGLLYIPIKNETVELKAGYDLYQNLHTKLDEYNLNQNRFDLTGSYRFSPSLAAGLSYSFEYLQIGGDPYAANHNITPSLSYTTGNGSKTVTSYRYRDSSYKTHPLFSSNGERSGRSHNISILQTIPAGEKIRFKLGYGFSLEETGKDYWDADEHKLSGGVMAQLPFGVIGDISAEAAFRRYDAPYPGSASIRDDKTWSGTALLSRPFGEHFSAIVGFTAIRNQSNLPSYDYSRTITSLLAQMRF